MNRTPGAEFPLPVASLFLIIAATWAVAVSIGSLPVAAADVDLVLRGGTIFDGTGSEGATGDVAIRGDRIVGVGRFEVDRAKRTIDCTGLVIAPGFIDLHTHCDGGLVDRVKRWNVNYLTQGCTTVVTGNCGSGSVKVGPFLDRIDRQGAGTNGAHLVPHGSVRRAVMGSADRPAKPDELEKMKELVDAGMREGAWGMSTGLIYVPGTFARTDEIVELAKVVASHGGIYVSHIRNEAGGLLGAVDEALRIGREAGLPVHISHFKVGGKPNWGLIRQAVAAIEAARGAGLKVTADQYPYIATSTSLSDTLFPATGIPGGRSNLRKRMEADPDLDRAVRKLVGERIAQSARVAIASSRNFSKLVGKGLREAAAERDVDPIDLALEIHDRGGASVVNFSLDEADVRYVMGIPWVATASDGSTLLPTAGLSPHPRSFGTFPRKIGHYAVREQVISMGWAVRSATGLPADILGLAERGYLRPGYWADVVVFDPAELIDRATFENPQRYSTGVRYLYVAGRLALEDGKPTGELAGRALRHKSISGQ